MTRWTNSLVGLALLAVTASPAAAAECLGYCQDDTGAARAVSAGECNPVGETCSAGCDTSAAGAPRPFAECVSRSLGKAVPRALVLPADGTRERDVAP